MRHKLRFDFKSLKFKLWAYFALFAVLLIVLISLLQILFLTTYYQDMKIRETNNVAALIQKEYKSKDFLEKVRALSTVNDMYIHIEAFDTIIFSLSTEKNMRAAYAYVAEMRLVKDQLLKSDQNAVSVIIPEVKTNTNTLAYAAYLENAPANQVILYIFSPLYPVASTVAILQKQLFYVVVISLGLAFVIAFYLSRRIAKPIRSITNSAKMLAEGEYGVTFEGKHYTEIINLADTLTYASSRLAKADTLQKDLMANVSHDLRTPLTMVKSYAEMIRDLSGDNPEKRNAHLQVIIEEADRLNMLVGDMLTLSRVQSGAAPLQKTDFDIKNAMEGILQSYAILREQEGYTILFDCDDGLIVNADQAKIKQVISNLLNNAIKYCGKDRLVILSIHKKGGGMRCEVIDRGMGIPTEELDHIWERYYKASTNHVRGASGTGLGLAIVKEILLLHNAKFGVNSELGKGSTFWFEL